MLSHLEDLVQVRPLPRVGWVLLVGKEARQRFNCNLFKLLDVEIQLLDVWMLSAVGLHNHPEDVVEKMHSF